VVKYDTIVELPSVEGLKPGMSAEVEVIIDRHEDVLTIPVAAVVETEEGDFCWVKSSQGTQRRPLRLGDTNDAFIVVKAGLKERDEVVLNPMSFVEELTAEMLKPLDGATPGDRDPAASSEETEKSANRETDHVG
jgi:multidrug efflux pump subunit AcrA (membrane-fusion protein)